MRTEIEETMTVSTPEKALERLQQGNARFRNNRRLDRDLLAQVRKTAEGQKPFAVVLGCIDSRTPPELIFDQGIGDIFSIRVAGNVLNGDVLGSMEFACQVAGARLIVVLGHSGCGAVAGACDRVKLGHLTGLVRKIEPLVALVQRQRELSRDELVQRVAGKNVEHVVEQIREQSQVLDTLIADGEVGLAGAMYSVETGAVAFQRLSCGEPYRP